MAQHVGDDIQEGVEKTGQAARSAVNTAKSVKKVAANLAEQNYVGAAVEAAKDENLRLVIVTIVLMSFLLMIAIFYIAPLSIYESIVAAAESFEDWWESVRESFDSRYYDGSDGRFVSFFKGIIGVIVDDPILRSISDTSAGTEDQADEDDLAVISDKDAMKKTYMRKVDACKNKITAREEQVANAVSGIGIENIMAGRFENEYAHIYDDDKTREIVYEGTDVNITKRSVSSNTAVYLIALYSSQINSSLQNIKLSGLLKWLGYNGGGGHTTAFPIGQSGLTAYLTAWKGTFMPRYLIDEATQRDMMDDYTDRYGCSVVDYLISVNCPNLYSIQPQIEETVRTEYKTVWIEKTLYYYEFQETANNRAPVLLPEYDWDGWLETDYRPSTKKYKLFNERYDYYWSEQYQRYIAYRLADAPPHFGRTLKWVTYYVEETVPYEITTYHVKFTVPVGISTRNAKGLLKMVGLWGGWRPSDPEYALFNEEGGEAA